MLFITKLFIFLHCDGNWSAKENIWQNTLLSTRLCFELTRWETRYSIIMQRLTATERASLIYRYLTTILTWIATVIFLLECSQTDVVILNHVSDGQGKPLNPLLPRSLFLCYNFVYEPLCKDRIMLKIYPINSFKLIFQHDKMFSVSVCDFIVTETDNFRFKLQIPSFKLSH